MGTPCRWADEVVAAGAQVEVADRPDVPEHRADVDAVAEAVVRRWARKEPRAAPSGPSFSKVTPEGGRFWQPDTRYSCAPPPWGELVAVNANTGNIAWRATLGSFDELAAKGLKTRHPEHGGSIATAGNLIFIGATVDGKFRAFDARNGKELWSAKLEAPAHSIPATYMGRDGKQYVVVSAAGGGFLRDPTADAVIAFALPTKGK